MVLSTFAAIHSDSPVLSLHKVFCQTRRIDLNHHKRVILFIISGQILTRLLISNSNLSSNVNGSFGLFTFIVGADLDMACMFANFY